MSLASTGGWCAPAEVTYVEAFTDWVRPEVWSPHLRPEDLDWIAEMLVIGEIYVDETDYLDMPTVSVRRGGVRS